jgi:hypothetical protein
VKSIHVLQTAKSEDEKGSMLTLDRRDFRAMRPVTHTNGSGSFPMIYNRNRQRSSAARTPGVGRSLLPLRASCPLGWIRQAIEASQVISDEERAWLAGTIHGDDGWMGAGPGNAT